VAAQALKWKSFRSPRPLPELEDQFFKAQAKAAGLRRI